MNAFHSIISIFLGICIIIYFPIQGTETQRPQEVWVNIFVHGIMSIKPHLSINNFLHFMNDTIQDTVYAKTVELMRNDKFFYQNQIMQEIGLKKVDLHAPIKQGNTSACLTNLLEQAIQYSAIQPVENHYYTFGWSGLLSPTIRYYEAKKLFVDLEELIAHYKRQGVNPRLRLVGYSHGGNVCLNLGAVRQNEFPQSSLSVDELILWGSPVQAETDYLIKDPLFKLVYHVYSYSDRIQRLDFFSFNRFFSRRTFRNRTRLGLPSKLIQVQLKITRSSPNVYHNPRKQALLHNFNIRGVVTGRSHLLREASPGHSELWFFGWTPLHYRKTFVLNPLPSVITLPFITHYVPKVLSQMSIQHPIIFDVRPDQGMILFKDRKGNVLRATAPFLSTETLTSMKEYAQLHEPDDFSEFTYNEHIKDAYSKAVEYHKQRLEEKRLARRQRRKERRLQRKNTGIKIIENS